MNFSSDNPAESNPSVSATPVQERSRASTDRMLAAATALFISGGYEAVTASEVARSARVAVGTLYGRFGNKDGLVKAVHAGLLGRLNAAIDALDESFRSAGGGSAGLTVPDWVSALATLLEAHANDLQPIMKQAALDPETAETGRRSYERLRAVFVDALAGGRHGTPEIHPPVACDHCFVIAYATLARALGLGTSPDATDPASLPTLTQVLGQMCEAFLAASR